MNIVTGYRATPHITSSQDRGANQGAYGRNSYILDVGAQLAAEIVSANEVRIRDGVLSHQGCVASIDQGAYDSLTISNGSQGLLRTDLIVARYSKDTETNVESMELVVIEGEAVASDPVAPAYNEGDIQAGDSPVDMPLYNVNINGVSLESVTQVATSLSNIEELQTAVSELNSKTNLKYATIDSESYTMQNNTNQWIGVVVPTGRKIVSFGWYLNGTTAANVYAAIQNDATRMTLAINNHSGSTLTFYVRFYYVYIED